MTKAALSPTEPDVITTLNAENLVLKERVGQLQTQINWFRRQLFGEKSEKRFLFKIFDKDRC